MEILKFNPSSPRIMHIDLNSCFATIEQQANPLLRGKPVAVAAYTTGNGCIVAPSVEAKKCGVKVGMRVREGKILCPNLIVLPPDPWKYREVHLALRSLIADYTNDFSPKSIDEFVLNLNGYTPLKGNPLRVGKEIKEKIKETVGDWLTVSVGIAPNRYLAKIAAGLKKPDGLEEINKDNFLNVYSGLELTDLTGIKEGNSGRLVSMGIKNVLDFYEAPAWKLKAAFRSIAGYYWYTRLRGWEIDDVTFARRSYGNSVALGRPLSTPEEIAPVLANLVEKATGRMRHAGYQAKGVHLALSYKDGAFWHRGTLTEKVLFDFRDVFKVAFKLFLFSPHKGPLRDIAVSCFNLIKNQGIQLEFFDDVEKKRKAVLAVDKINERWGSFVIKSGAMLRARGEVKDRIAFGGVKELEEFTLH